MFKSNIKYMKTASKSLFFFNFASSSSLLFRLLFISKINKSRLKTVNTYSENL